MSEFENRLDYYILTMVGIHIIMDFVSFLGSWGFLFYNWFQSCEDSVIVWLIYYQVQTLICLQLFTLPTCLDRRTVRPCENGKLFFSLLLDHLSLLCGLIIFCKIKCYDDLSFLVLAIICFRYPIHVVWIISMSIILLFRFWKMKRILNSIPLETYRIVNAESVDSCAICLSLFEEGQQLRKLSCLHKFHKICVDSWLISKKNCPLCRNAIIF